MTNEATYQVVLPDGGLYYETFDEGLAEAIAADVDATVIVAPAVQLWVEVAA